MNAIVSYVIRVRRATNARDHLIVEVEAWKVGLALVVGQNGVITLMEDAIKVVLMRYRNCKSTF